MAEAKAQKARRVLVQVVSSYDPKTVRKTAVENSTEFRDFLAKGLESDGLDSLDVMDIMTELEDELEITLPDTPFKIWQDAFDKILLLLNEE
uniref:Acyl carrier protein-like superfamily protein n=1 Tax=Burkholderia phage vB_BgluM-SURPRISE13 TaxID=3159457 RepID=A0AAU7PFI3_9VIRU